MGILTISQDITKAPTPLGWLWITLFGFLAAALLLRLIQFGFLTYWLFVDRNREQAKRTWKREWERRCFESWKQYTKH